jgi:hypothetical protein
MVGSCAERICAEKAKNKTSNRTTFFSPGLFWLYKNRRPLFKQDGSLLFRSEEIPPRLWLIRDSGMRFLTFRKNLIFHPGLARKRKTSQNKFKGSTQSL